MNAAPHAFRNASSVVSARETDRSASVQKSCTKVFEPRDFRAYFAARFACFLQSNYRNPEEVSVAFGVRYQTAFNWWQGINKPSGDVVAMAFLRHGAALTRHLEARK